MAWKTHWKTVAIAAVGAPVVAFGAGGTAWALHGNDQPARTTSTSTSARLGGGHGARGAIGRRGLLRRLSSAEITVAANGTARVIRIDHGTIASISSTAVTLQEADGRTVRIPLDSSTRVVLDGATA